MQKAIVEKKTSNRRDCDLKCFPTYQQRWDVEKKTSNRRDCDATPEAIRNYQFHQKQKRRPQIEGIATLKSQAIKVVKRPCRKEDLKQKGLRLKLIILFYNHFYVEKKTSNRRDCDISSESSLSSRGLQKRRPQIEGIATHKACLLPYPTKGRQKRRPQIEGIATGDFQKITFYMPEQKRRPQIEGIATFLQKF